LAEVLEEQEQPGTRLSKVRKVKKKDSKAAIQSYCEKNPAAKVFVSKNS
jgi:hypothetical protein